MDTRDKLRAFLVQILTQNGDIGELKDDDSLLLTGRLQSVDAIEIALFLEKEFGIDFSELGFDETQIDSLDRIAHFVEQHGRPLP